MALSDAEIKRLAEKAEVCWNAVIQAGDPLTHLKEALKCYDQIIEQMTLGTLCWFPLEANKQGKIQEWTSWNP